jgi:L-threonylcarbamoyladenylate synthase
VIAGLILRHFYGFIPTIYNKQITMATSSIILTADDTTLGQAASLLEQGQIVAFPTETVYGLGADATNDRAIARIYEAKGRPQFNPLIIHVDDGHSLERYVTMNNTAAKLMKAFWPGPLTLVLPRAPTSPIGLLASAGLETLAMRCPAHPVARALIRKLGKPIAAPSANASGTLSPTRAEHVAASLGDKVPMILDGGACEVGLESTVLDLTTATPTILRHGAITKEMLQDVLGTIQESLDDPAHPKSPGMLLSHYAPRLPLRLNAMEASENEALLTFGDDTVLSGGAMRFNLSRKGDLIEAAANLFAMLREADQPRFTGIAVMPIPTSSLGTAINDRLSRAAHS